MEHTLIGLNTTLKMIEKHLARIATALEEDNKIVKDITGAK